MALPYLDSARLRHWMWGNEWTEAADALWLEEGLDKVFKLFRGDEYEIQGSIWREEFWKEGEPPTIYDDPVELSAEQQRRFDDLLSAGHLGIVESGDTSVYMTLGGAQRSGRQFFVDLVSPRDGYQHAMTCDGQYTIHDSGFCELELGPNWLLHYSWFLTFERQLAKCDGVLRENPTRQTEGDRANAIYMSREERFSAAVEELGEDEAMRLAARGAAEMRAALSGGNVGEVNWLIDQCEFP